VEHVTRFLNEQGEKLV